MTSLMIITNTLPAAAALAVLALVILDAVRGGSETRPGWALVTAGLALVTLAVSADSALSGLTAPGGPYQGLYPVKAAVSLGGVIALALGIRRWSGRPPCEVPAKAGDGEDRGKTAGKTREAEDRYRALFEESMDAVFTIAPDGRFTDVNPAGVELFGYESAGELETVNFRDELWVSGPEVRRRFSRQMAETGSVADYEIKVRRKDGGILTCRFCATVLPGSPAGFRYILRDVTESRRLADQLLQAQKMEAVGQLTGGIAHDFNNMIMAIMMYSDLVARKLPEGSPISANVEKIKTITKRAEGLTRRLLAFSRKQMVRPEVTDVNKVVTSVERLLERVIGEDVEFRTEMDGGPLKVMGDGGQLEQLITNLVTNARDAMPDGGSITISTSTASIDEAFIEAHGFGIAGLYSLITVRDTGTGMDPDTAGRVFEPFFTTKPAERGTGLGLSVAYGIVKQHSGFIDVDSSPGAGTVFSIYLPLIDHAGEGEEDTAGPAPVAVRGVGTVLIAEDDPAVREVACRVLEDGGFTVVEAVDGEDAVAKFMDHRDRVELVILDVIMPRMNGKEARDRMAEVSPGVKTLFMSGYTDDIVGNTGVMEDSKQDFISKPVSPAELLEIVGKAIDDKAA